MKSQSSDLTTPTTLMQETSLSIINKTFHFVNKFTSNPHHRQNIKIKHHSQQP